MKIIIVAATKFEVDPLLDQMDSIESAKAPLISCSYCGHTVDILIAGVGMVSTTYYTTKYLNSTYDLAFNVGVCGSFNTNLEIGSVVNVYEDCFSELGAEDGKLFLSLEDMELDGVTRVTNQGNTISNSIIDHLPKVTGITVNTTHGNEESIEKVFEKFHPYVESMEGAAFMMVCDLENIPYAQIRSVSNRVELRNKDNWNLPLAIDNLNKKLIEIIDVFVK